MKELQKALFAKLEGTGWDIKFRFFTDFSIILETLHHEAEEERRFTPGIKDILNPFELTPLDEVKVVFLVPEPFLNPSLNDGLALSCKETERLPLEIFRLRQELEKEFPKSPILTNKRMFDLIPWAEQGVLLLNSSLTARIQNKGRHKEIWAPFTYQLLDVLNRRSDLAFAFFGDTGYWDNIDSKHFKIQLKDLPTQREDAWSSEKVFSKINEFLRLKNIPQINW